MTFYPLVLLDVFRALHPLLDSSSPSPVPLSLCVILSAGFSGSGLLLITGCGVTFIPIPSSFVLVRHPLPRFQWFWPSFDNRLWWHSNEDRHSLFGGMPTWFVQLCWSPCRIPVRDYFWPIPSSSIIGRVTISWGLSHFVPSLLWMCPPFCDICSLFVKVLASLDVLWRFWLLWQ